jgi:hypothetical protein
MDYFSITIVCIVVILTWFVCLWGFRLLFVGAAAKMFEGKKVEALKKQAAKIQDDCMAHVMKIQNQYKDYAAFYEKYKVIVSELQNINKATSGGEK